MSGEGVQKGYDVAGCEACAAGMMPAELDHITECSEACTDLGGSVL